MLYVYMNASGYIRDGILFRKTAKHSISEKLEQNIFRIVDSCIGIAIYRSVYLEKKVCYFSS